jgi:hypothetical protein
MRNGLIICLLVLCCCGPHEQQSTIVERAEKAGSGPLAGVTTPAIQQWLAQHKEVAWQINDMCRPVRSKAPVEWRESTEGRVCEAAAEIAFWRVPKITGDARTFSPAPDSSDRKR